MPPQLPNNPQGFMAYMQQAPQASAEEYRSLKKQMPDIEPLFESMRERTDIGVPDIESYLETAVGTGNAFEAHLQLTSEKMKDSALPAIERVKAEKELQSLAVYMNKRNEVFLNASHDLDELSNKVESKGMSPEQEPTIDPANLIGTIKGGFGAVLDGFRNAKTPGEKAILLAGVGASILIAYKFLTGSNIISRKTRNWGGTALGLYVLYMGYKVIDRSYSLTRGKPMFNLTRDEQPLAYNEKEWNEKSYKEQLKNTVEELKRGNKIDDALITRMLNVTGTENIHYVKGLTNFGAMNIRDFLDTYERSIADLAVQDADWPDYPCADSEEFPQHNLSPRERFVIMQEMGKTIGLIESNGDVKTDIDEDMLNQSVFYGMMNYSS